MSKAFQHDRTIGSDDWLTPPGILSKLGKFDLDPCAAMRMPWETASIMYSKEINGLKQNWKGRVFLNPPYSRNLIDPFLERMKYHNNGIALIFARTDTAKWFNHIWDYVDGILFIKGRLKFWNVNGTPGKTNAGAPSVLLAYGRDNAEMLKYCGIEGKYIDLVKTVTRQECLF